MAGKVFRRPDGTGFTEWSEAHLILFDHYRASLDFALPALLARQLTSARRPQSSRPSRRGNAMAGRSSPSAGGCVALLSPDRRRADACLRSSQPVPLDLIQLKPSSFSEPPVPRSSGFHLRSAKFTGTERHPSNGPPTASPSTQDSALAYPIAFHQMGRYNGLVYYYVDSAAVRQEWEKRLREAIALRAERQEANRVVRLDPLADQTFGSTSTIGSLAPDAPTANQFGRPTCSVPLTTADGQSLVVAGCSEGLFIGFRGRPRSMRQVVHLSGITQCAVLPDFGFVLVVANRVLIACEHALPALLSTRKY